MGRKPAVRFNSKVGSLELTCWFSNSNGCVIRAPPTAALSSHHRDSVACVWSQVCCSVPCQATVGVLETCDTFAAHQHLIVHIGGGRRGVCPLDGDAVTSGAVD